jgi:hypothetical protein
MAIRANSVNIATGYGLNGRSSIPGRVKSFSLIHRAHAGPWAHPASYPMGTEGSFSGVKLQEREGGRPPSSSVEINNGGAITPLSLMSSWHNA